jgi:hypothetical protein
LIDLHRAAEDAAFPQEVRDFPDARFSPGGGALGGPAAGAA